MSQVGQSPEPGQHGSFLHQASVAGQQVEFVAQTDADVAFILLNASGDASNFDFGTITANFSYIVNGVTYPWESIIAWNYMNFYIDSVGFATEYLYRTGSSVSGTSAALRKSMSIDIYPGNIIMSVTPSPGTQSHRTIYYLKNNDVSATHYANILSIWKYIVTGGPNV